jgi:hypothetical protein
VLTGRIWWRWTVSVTFDELWPTRRLISSKIDIAADLVGDTGIEPVTSSV